MIKDFFHFLFNEQRVGYSTNKSKGNFIMNNIITFLLFLLFTGTTANALASPLIQKKLCFQTDEPNAPHEWKITWYLHFSPIEGEQNIYSVNGFEFGEKKTPLKHL